MKKIILIIIVLFILIMSTQTINAAGGSSPVLTLVGGAEIYYEVGATYFEHGATATDSEDGNITSSIVIDSSAVNTTANGTYIVTYTVTDADENTAIAQRTIQVGKSINSEKVNDYSLLTDSYDSSYNYYSDVQALHDGSFAAVGRTYQSSHYYSGILTYPVMNVIRNGEIQYSDAYFYQGHDQEGWNKLIVNSSNNIYTIGSNNNSYGGIGLFTSSSLVTKTYYTTRRGQFRSVAEIDTNKYAIYDTQYNYIYIFSGTTYQRYFSISGSMVDITSNMDDYIYIKTQNGTTASINKISSTGTTVWTKVIPDTIIAELGFINNELTLVGTTTNTVDTSIAKTNGGQDGIVIKLDQDGNILTSKTYGGKGNDTFDLANFNSNSIAIKYNSSSIDGTLEQTSKGLIVINASNLNSFNKSLYSSEFSYLNGIAINEDGVIALAGGNGIGNLSRLRLVEVEPIYAIGFEDNSIDYGSSFDPELNTKFVDNFGNELNKIITSIEGSVNTTVVGNHVIYYNLSVLTESGYKNLRLKRTITVVPTLNINEGDMFSGSVPLNINGGTISINGNPYTKGDTYNIPGNSVLEITGINGYVKTINFSVDLIQSGIIEGYQYAEPVALTFSGGTATLNGNPYISGTVITEKGNHEIVITGANGFTETITFSILPVVLNVENNGVYLETITPNINAENMTLNGSVYNNEPIVNAGNYQLVITGVGGYVETINFIIETTITGVAEGVSYDGSVEVNYTKGTGTLNGNPFSSGDVITNPGDNTITITGESGYTKTVSFVVNLVTTELTNGAVYNPSLTPTFSGGTITLNGNPYLSGELIEIPGFYTLVVSGETGYSKTYYFNVEPEFVNVINGQTYYEPRVVANSKGNVTLNGNPYVSNTILNTSGSYTLQIVGAGGYLRTINFTMAGGSNVIDNESYILEHTIYFIGDATLDGVSISSGHVVNLVGNHTFELVDGTYTESKTFTIIPDYAPYNQDIFMNHTINIHNASLSLDGVAIANTLEISSVGTYNLTVNGVNGYTNTINFDVLPSVNVTNEMTYEEAFNLVTSGGTATLNGESFDGDGLLTTVGKYTLTITGHGSYTETWVFYIKPTITNLQEEGLYIDSVMPIINHDSLLLDGITYVSGTIIDSEGFHTLSILGSNGYQLDIMFIIVTSHLGIEDGMTYIESVSIESTVFDMTVNGMSYTSGTSIDTLGVNTLELFDGTKTKEITFYIIPTLINIEEGGTYVGSVTPIINHNNLLLNSALYQSGTPVSSVGNHVLKVVNVGSGSTLYTFEISFKVIENPVNISIGGEYTGAVTPNVPNVQSLKLDGVAYSNNTTISTVGNHTLMIYGLNGYESQIDFIIHPTISNISDLGVYTSSVNAVIPNATLLLDGNAYTSGGIINQVGYHELIINGTNGYFKTLNFTILPNIQNVIDGGVYLSNSPKAPVVNYSESLALNGDTFISGTTVNMVGNYVLTVYGTGGYEYSISFVFNFVLTGITDGGQYTGSARPVVANATLDLNGLPHIKYNNIRCWESFLNDKWRWWLLRGC